jgi:hypothetical protein
VPCDLSDWEHIPQPGTIGVDPVLGRIAFRDNVFPSDVQVSYYYGFSSEVGGGFYERHTPNQAGDNSEQYDIGKSLSIKTVVDALSSWEADNRPNAVFCIRDSQIYNENIPELSIPAGITLEIKADDEERPVLHLAGRLKIKGETAAKDQPGGQVIIDGLLIAGERIEILDGNLGYLQILHSTLVPGLDLNPDSTPMFNGQESLVVEKGNLNLHITINRSITGSLKLESADCLSIKDSIIDGLDDIAIKGPSVTIEESTILGNVSVKAVKLGSNSIFTGEVIAERKQEGCMRFSFFPRNSKVPRQYHCQPETAIQNAVKKEVNAALAKDPGMSPQEQQESEETLREELGEDISARLKPFFTALRYSYPGYAQLHVQCPEEIRKGADDEAEMGVFHHLQQPQREANLRVSLEEYLRVGLEAGIFYVT